MKRIKSSYCLDLYNYLDKYFCIVHIYQEKNVHVTDMTNHDGGDGDDIVCDGYDIHMQMSYPSRKIVTEMTVTEMTAQNVFQS